MGQIFWVLALVLLEKKKFFNFDIQTIWTFESLIESEQEKK